MSNKVFIHSESVNLARRYSVQNENDLMQENLYEDTWDNIPRRQFDHDTCQELSRHLLHPNALPSECKKFQDVVTSLRRRDSDTTHGTQVLG